MAKISNLKIKFRHESHSNFYERTNNIAENKLVSKPKNEAFLSISSSFKTLQKIFYGFKVYETP